MAFHADSYFRQEESSSLHKQMRYQSIHEKGKPHTYYYMPIEPILDFLYLMHNSMRIVNIEVVNHNFH